MATTSRNAWPSGWGEGVIPTSLLHLLIAFRRAAIVCALFLQVGYAPNANIACRTSCRKPWSTCKSRTGDKPAVHQRSFVQQQLTCLIRAGRSACGPAMAADYLDKFKTYALACRPIEGLVASRCVIRSHIDVMRDARCLRQQVDGGETLSPRSWRGCSLRG